MPKLLSREAIEAEGLNDHIRTYHYDAQSIGFMTEIIPTLQALYEGRERKLSVGDIGARTGAGTDLLAQVFSPYSNGKLKLDLTAIDIDTSFFRDTQNPHFRFCKQDIFAPDAPVFDFTICSHTIEHVEDMPGFIRRVQQLSRDYAIFACPVDETIYSYFTGHQRVVERGFVERLRPIRMQFYSSNHWLNSDAGIFVLPGRARRGDWAPEPLTAAMALAGTAGSGEERLQKLTALAAEHPGHAATRYEIGALLSRSGDAGAARYLAQAVALDPSYIHYTMRLFAHHHAAISGAEPVLTEPLDAEVTRDAVARCRNDLDLSPYPACVLGEALERARVLDGAAALFDLAGSMGYAHGYYRAALVHKQARDGAAALRSVEHGLALAADSPDLQWALAIIHADMFGDSRSALDPARHAAQAKPYLPRMTRTAARICAEQGQEIEAAHWARLGEDYSVH